MCESYSEVGAEKIGLPDLATGAFNFICVAVGGTVIGKFYQFSYLFYQIA